jgi:hypothetical protein
MKRTQLLVPVVLLTTAAAIAEPESGFHKKISVEYAPVSIGDVLADIEKKTGVRIACDDETLKGVKPVTLKAENKTAGRILTDILRRRGLKSRFDGGNQVTVVRHNWHTPLTKKEDVYEFVRKPTVTKLGKDTYAIEFETKGWCDCTVAIEDADGRIRRHLASGVLGPNAPEPFVWNSKKQRVVWDGKDDQGEYVARGAGDYDKTRIRVSLGLKARLERTLFWSPKKRAPATGHEPVQMCPAPEGVYVYDGGFGDHLKLFDHGGNYIRTIYPFPADKLQDVVGLKMHRESTPGHPMPLKWGLEMATLLTMGWPEWGGSKWPSGKGGVGGAHANSYAGVPFGNRATAMAVHGKRIALARVRLNRLGTDGTSGGLPMHGPDCWFARPGGPDKGLLSCDPFTMMAAPDGSGRMYSALPGSIAFSPDGKWLYATGYLWTAGSRNRERNSLPGVARMAYARDKRAERWVGSMNPRKDGTGDGQFRFPTALAVDAKGRVYVCDYMNDRVQIFSPDAKLLKTLKTTLPADIRLDRRTGEVFVFSWGIGNSYWLKRGMGTAVTPVLTRYRAFPELKKTAAWPLPYGHHYKANQIRFDYGWSSPIRSVAIDSATTPPMLWYYEPENYRAGPKRSNIRLYEIGEHKLKLKRSFYRDAMKQVCDLTAPTIRPWRLFVDQKRGRLYVSGGKLFNELIRIDPETGRERKVKTPFQAEDLTFDLRGRAYFRTSGEIVRYEPVGSGDWREVPFDYGEKHNVGHTANRAPQAPVVSCIVFPGDRNSHRQYFGIATSPKGHIAVGTPYSYRGKANGGKAAGAFAQGTMYRPQVYPGRSGKALITVFDKHGKVVHEDALQGAQVIDGVRIDKDDNLYVQVSGLPLVNGKLPPQPNLIGCTLMKAGPKKLRMRSKDGIVPLPKAQWPDRPPDFMRMNTTPVWVDGADWMYGDVGISGISTPVNNCHCQANARFDLDYFARSFAIEVPKFRVAVLDTNGNVIARVGRYGNIEDGSPLAKKGGPEHTRSIGGVGSEAAVAVSRGKLRRRSEGSDEVAIMNVLQLAVHTDKRLFLADIGNYCIRSVKLGYHTTQRIPLKGAH